MTIDRILSKLEAKRLELALSDNSDVHFVMFGIRCRIYFIQGEQFAYAYKYPLMAGYHTIALEELARYIHRFQF